LTTPTRYRAVTGRLTFQTALHIGVGRGGVGTDSPLRRDGHGYIFLPGTAVAGAMRTAATRLAEHLFSERPCKALEVEGGSTRTVCGCRVCKLFGELYPNENDSEAEGGHASRLWVFDAPLRSPGTDGKSTSTFVRDGVGIDRATGTAARVARLKFDTEVVPAGAEFKLRLELQGAEGDTDQDHNERLLAAVLAEWSAGRCWLGGDSARGLGQAILSEVRLVRNDLATTEDLMSYLAAADPIDGATEVGNWLADRRRDARAAAHGAGKRPFIHASFKLAFDGPFLIHDEAAATLAGYDHVSLMDGVPGTGAGDPRPVLPGASLRGALRSHAERIARSIVTRKAAERDTFLEQCPACDPTQDDAEKPLAKCDTLLRSVVASNKPVSDAHLCLACRLFGSSRRGSRLRVMDAPIVDDPQWKVLDFLAIDRFTGGALEGAKFDAAALWRPVFDVRLFLEEPEDWEIGWLALVLRDLAEGRITIGFGAAKGFGQARVRDIQVRCGYANSRVWQPLDLAGREDAEAAGFYSEALLTDADWSAIQESLTNCVKEFTAVMTNLSRSSESLPKLKADSYFGHAGERHRVDSLYRIRELDDVRS